MLWIGVGGAVLAVLGLVGLVDPPRRYSSGLALYGLIASGVCVTVVGVLVVINGRRHRGHLLCVDAASIRIQQAHRRVEVELAQVSSVESNLHHGRPRLSVLAVDGRRLSPILQPQDSDWESVAVEVGRRLIAYRLEAAVERDR